MCAVRAGSLRLRYFVPFGAADGDGGGSGEDVDFCLFLGRAASLPSSLPSSF
jgi:hypothetical protein